MEKQYFKLNNENVENLETFSDILKKDMSNIINTALEEFFVKEHKKLLDKNIYDESALTNLDFNEFWDDLDI